MIAARNRITIDDSGEFAGTNNIGAPDSLDNHSLKYSH
jgi:hypothetical protein